MNGIILLLSETSKIEDFRKARGQRYKLHHLLSIFILAVVAGADDFVAVETFAKSKKAFLTKNGLIQNEGIPSHDIFRWILEHLDKSSLAQLLGFWLQNAVDHISATDLSKATQVSRIRKTPQA
ncbi:MAG: transposase family protein, partial [Chitinophagales bacterium]